jgi:hypothetical protein
MTHKNQSFVRDGVEFVEGDTVEVEFSAQAADRLFAEIQTGATAEVPVSVSWVKQATGWKGSPRGTIAVDGIPRSFPLCASVCKVTRNLREMYND